MKFRMMSEKKQRCREGYKLWMKNFWHIRSTSYGGHKTVSMPAKDIYILRLLRRDIKWAELSWEKFTKFDSHVEVHITW